MSRSPALVRLFCCVALALVLALAGCGKGREGEMAPIGYGTVGGGAAGALTGALVAKNPAVMAGGAVVGGLLGNEFVDKPRAQRKRREAEARQSSERYLAEKRERQYARQSEEQEEEMRREAQQQRLYEQWRQERTGSQASGDETVDIKSAQRLLAAHGHYQGPVDGIYSDATEVAVKRFQAERGLPQDGRLTIQLMSKMRATL